MGDVRVEIAERVVGNRRAAPGAVTALADRARLARFAAALVVKERLAPRLHVRPLVAELFLTDNCNLRCISCTCWRTTTRGELRTAEWRHVLDQLADLGIVKANFTGGEPLLRADAPALMAHAHDAGIRHLHLNTNAVLLDDRRLGAVLDAGVRSFNISLDGPDAATHEAVRGVAGSFDQTLAHLGTLLERRSPDDLRVRVNLTVLRANLGTLPDMVRLAQRLEVPLSLNLASDTTFLFRHPDVTDQARLDTTELDRVLAEVEDLLRLDPRMLPPFSQWRYLRRHFTEPVVTSPPCAESQLKLLVRSTGDVGGCWGHDGVVNVRDRPLADIVSSRHYRDEHTRLYRKECVGCGSNYALNVRLRPSSHLHDRSWRQGRRRLTDLGTGR